MRVHPQFPHIAADGSSWSTDLGPVGDMVASFHEDTIIALLDTMNSTQSGHELLSRMEDRCKRFNKRVTVVPYSLADRAKDPVNSFPELDDQNAAMEIGRAYV